MLVQFLLMFPRNTQKTDRAHVCGHLAATEASKASFPKTKVPRKITIRALSQAPQKRFLLTEKTQIKESSLLHQWDSSLPNFFNDNSFLFSFFSSSAVEFIFPSVPSEFTTNSYENAILKLETRAMCSNEPIKQRLIHSSSQRVWKDTCVPTSLASCQKRVRTRNSLLSYSAIIPIPMIHGPKKHYCLTYLNNYGDRADKENKHCTFPVPPNAPTLLPAGFFALTSNISLQTTLEN